MLKRVVIAGNFREFKDWIRFNHFNEQDYIYLSNAYSCRGIHAVPLIKVGTYWTREDIPM